MNKQTQAQWKPTCKRFIAFMDIMGFKDLLFRGDHKSILLTIKSFRSSIYPLNKDANLKGHNSHAKPMIKPIFFSDSILLISNDDSKESAEELLFKAQWLLGQALLVGIPMKGAIAYGEQTADFNKSLHIGRPLVHAYELQNELFLYGIVLHHTMEHYLNSIKIVSYLEENGLICNYETPMKSGNITHWLTEWDKDFLKKDTLDAVLTRLYGSVSGPPRRYVDNTANFARWLNKPKPRNKS